MVWPSWDIPWHTLRLTTSTPYTNGFSLRASCFFRSTSRRRFTQCFATRHLPISIDIVLSDQHCDLLNPKQQAQWLPWARQGAIHMAIGGPPCETWSVSRLRWHEEQEGSRSLRNGSRLENHIWGLPQLRIQEARQVRVANSLLHFCILPMIRQSASTVFPIHIKQEYWNAISPKPKFCWRQFRRLVDQISWNTWRASGFQKHSPHRWRWAVLHERLSILQFSNVIHVLFAGR